jgi:hypothetical protein
MNAWNEKATAIVDTIPKEARGVRRPRIQADVKEVRKHLNRRLLPEILG